MHSNIISKTKVYDNLPIAFNTQLLTNHLKHSEQEQNLKYYLSLAQSNEQVYKPAQSYSQDIERFRDQFQQANDNISKVYKEAQRVSSECNKYQEEIQFLNFKKKLIAQLYEEVTLSEAEKKVLFEEDEDEIQSQKITNQFNFEVEEEDEKDTKFDKFKEDFFKALNKLNKMHQIINSLDQNSVLAKSIKENCKLIEDQAYTKLVKHLKEKIRIFDTTLENQPEFLTFMNVTFKILKEKSIDLYVHIINELIKSRAKYIEFSLKESVNNLQNLGMGNEQNQLQESRKLFIKNIAKQIAWLHEALINEVQILDHISLNKQRYLEALNSIFNEKITKQIKQILFQELQQSQQDDFSQQFELYYIAVSFQKIMNDHFIKQLQICQEDNINELQVLSIINEIKQKTLTTLIQSSEQSFTKLYNLFKSQANQNTLQLERIIKCMTTIIYKLILEINQNDKKDLDTFRKNILSYAIIRILPKTSIDIIKDYNIQPQNLVQMFNYYDQLKKAIQLDIKIFKDEEKLIRERLEYLQIVIKDISFFDLTLKRQTFNKLLNLEQLSLDQFKQNLEELEEEFEYEEVRIIILQGIEDQDMRQLIGEMVKEELIRKLREILERVIDNEFEDLDGLVDISEEERAKREKILNYSEFEITEKLEYIRKKIYT